MTHATQDEGREPIAKAMSATHAAILGADDPTRPAFHFRAPAQWMNDPNGPIYYRGWYHLFYQFNPYGDQWGNMHWGHARSRDLVDWEHLPIAVWPSKSKREDHVYSGSTYLDGTGQPAILYTSIGPRDPEQWIAVPGDRNLVTWKKPDANPVVSTRTHRPTQIDEWRDPFLFSEAGSTYMVTGGRHEGHGIVALYEAKRSDLTAWRYRGILFQHPDSNLIECPNLVKLGDRWLLLTSHDGRVDSFTGELDLKGKAFRSSRRGVLAEGSYASQLLTNRKGQTVHLAWMPTSDHKGWNGYLTLPSILTLDGAGDVVRKPIPELRKLRNHKVELRNTVLRGELDLGAQAEGHQLELVVDVDSGDATTLRFRIGTADIVFDARERRLQVPGRSPISLPKGPVKLHVFLDRSALDVYADGGRATRCVSLPPGQGTPRVSLAAEGGTARIRSLQLFSLRGAKFDLTAFK
jgi:beta-fructofuranosidase